MFKFNIAEIERSLELVRQNFKKINASLTMMREDFTKEHVEHIICAYDYLNNLLDDDISLFSKAGLYSLLELNHLVLCGADTKKRFEYHKHIMQTRTRFYSRIKQLVKWYRYYYKQEGPYKLSAGFYRRQLSQPQLFIEGNHRTGNILVNYILMGFNKPPFILDTENAYYYFEPSGKMKFSDKFNIFDNVFLLPNHEKDFRNLLKKYGSNKYIME